MKKSSNITKDSHDLSYLLRHDKTYAFETGGWRSVENLVREQGFTFEQLCDLVANDDKGRFEFNEDKTMIRALYGHSVQVDMDYSCCTPPEILYHGTSMNADVSILDNGLIPRSRNYVHLTNDNDAALETGSRHGAPVTIRVKALEMFNAGYEFYNPTKGIWLVREVPKKFIDSYYCPFESLGEKSLNHKLIKVVCDSDAVVSELKEDNTVSPLCDIVHLNGTSLSIHTLEEYFSTQIYIVAITGKRNWTDDYVRQIVKLKEYTNDIILIAPEIIQEVTSVQATASHEIHSILFSLCLLLGHNQPMRLGLRDITTFLFATNGELKVVQAALDDDFDTTGLCENLKTELKDRHESFKSCIIHISLPDGHQVDMRHIMAQDKLLEDFIRGMIPGIQSCSCPSVNMSGGRNIHISVFLH